MLQQTVTLSETPELSESIQDSQESIVDSDKGHRKSRLTKNTTNSSQSLVGLCFHFMVVTEVSLRYQSNFVSMRNQEKSALIGWLVCWFQVCAILYIITALFCASLKHHAHFNILKLSIVPITFPLDTTCFLMVFIVPKP